MYHVIHAFKGPAEPLPVADIAYKKTQFRRIFFEIILHMKLFEFVPGINNDFFRIIMFHDVFGKSSAKSSGTACDQDRFIVQHVNLFSSFFDFIILYSIPIFK